MRDIICYSKLAKLQGERSNMTNNNEQFKIAKEAINKLFENSTCQDAFYKKIDKLHSQYTLEWVLRLEPNASVELQIAALGHDIDRTNEVKRIKKEDYKNYDEYKKDHSQLSATILCEELLRNGIDKGIVEKVRYLVINHEIGGDRESDILKEADSLAFFDDIIDSYYRERGLEKVKQKIRFMYSRLDQSIRKEIKNKKYSDKEVQRIVYEVTEEVDRNG